MDSCKPCVVNLGPNILPSQNPNSSGVLAGGSGGGGQKRKVNDENQDQAHKKQRTGIGNGSGSGDDLNQAGGSKATGNDDNAADRIDETFADYKPAKLKIGVPHKQPVVETAMLASIQPNDITYNLLIPQKTIDEGKLSVLQLESIVYASQAHKKVLSDGQRLGYFIG